MDLAAVRRAYRTLEPLHSMIYFSAEAEPAFTALGLAGGPMPYFASRAAPMGAVGPEVVAATFYNFNPRLVEQVIPAAWALAEPAEISRVRFEVAAAALRRLLGDAVDSPQFAEVTELTTEAGRSATTEGRPLYAAHTALERPTDPVAAFWHSITLLREYRGDGHLSALVQAGLAGLEALVINTATGLSLSLRAAQQTRGYSSEQWAEAVARLTRGGMLTESGELSAAGAAARERIETATDEISATPLRALGEQRVAELTDKARGLTRTLLAAGAFPPQAFAPNSDRRKG